MKQKFNSSSEWVKAGHVETGWVEVFPSGRETEKAIAVKCTKFTACANAYEGTAWLPKSQLQVVPNDFYVNCGPMTVLAPSWLIQSKKREGVEI